MLVKDVCLAIPESDSSIWWVGSQGMTFPQGMQSLRLEIHGNHGQILFFFLPPQILVF